MARGPGAVSDAGTTWTRFDDVKGWEMPFRTKGFGISMKMNKYTPVVLLMIVLVVLVVPPLVLSTAYVMFLILVDVMVIIVAVTTFQVVFMMSRQIAETFGNLFREVDLTPEEVISRVESALVSARMPFTRLSREDPDMYWKDDYLETFVISGGRVRIRVYDERPSGTGKATKVYVGPATAESERLASTLAWHLEKVLPNGKP